MNQHIALRRTAGIAVVAAGLLIGAGPPVTASAADDPSTLISQRSRPEAGQNRGLIQFAAGATSAAVNGAVARGDWHHWGVRAQRGQTIQVTVAATAGNATFEVYTPGGAQLANDVVSFNGPASATGLYAVDVGSTGGLANYTLTVSVTGVPTAPAPPPAPGNLPGHFQGRIQFASGASSGSVSGTVERGNWHEWSFQASAGQTAALTVSAAAGNSTFSLYAPNGNVLAAHTTSFSGTLPAAGLYMIEVGSTGGTAGYTLNLTITGSAAPPTPPAPPPTPGNLPGHFQGRIQFASGASSGSVSGTVERGNWHEWSFQASAGQTAALTVSAAAGNATFSLYAPNGNVLAAHISSFSGTLPAAGFYMIEVGSTGGTASYTLNLSIT